jgi:hypothetical protein
VRDGLKKVRLVNVKDHADRKITFDGGVLEMHVSYAEGANALFSDNEIRALLLKGL